MNSRRNVTALLLSRMDDCAAVDIPSVVKGRCCSALLDYIGVAYAGRTALRGKVNALESMSGAVNGDGLVLGSKGMLPIKDAVFLNGLNAHALDLDDGVNAGIIHLGSPIFSLLIPLAAKHGVSGGKLIKATVLGYEVAWTLAYSIQPAHKLKGFHATGTCGMLGAIAAGAYLLDFTEQERFRAFSTGCVSAGGTLKVLEDGSELKPYNVAKAALLALVSLQMGKAGFEVPDDAMSGDRGFLQMMAGSQDVEIKPFMLDSRYAITRTYTKPYAACRYCHPAIEAAISLERSGKVPLSDVERIEVRTYDLAVKGHDHTEIEGIASAKMSIPYGVAVGYLKGKAGLAEYSEEAVSDPAVLSLCAKVAVFSDDDLTAAFPEQTVANVRLVTRRGDSFERRVDHPLGEPENPLGDEGVRQKFCEMTTFAGMPPDWQSAVISAVSNVEEDFLRLISLLSEEVRR